MNQVNQNAFFIISLSISLKPTCQNSLSLWPQSRPSSLETLLPEPNLPELPIWWISSRSSKFQIHNFNCQIVKIYVYSLDINILKEDIGNDWGNFRIYNSLECLYINQYPTSHQAIAPNEFIQMEPGRHVDCGHCLDMERGHSSLAPLERVAFRARLSCPGHLVTACHGYRHNLLARLTNPRPTCKQKSQMSLGSPDCCEGPLRQNAHLRNSAL